MTRDEAMKKAYKEALQISVGNSSNNLSRLIDKIYDDFDTRICKNCAPFAQVRDKDYGDCFGKARKLSDINRCYAAFGCNQSIRKNNA